MLTLKRYTLLKDLVLLTIAMFIGSLGWAIFLLPNHITTGGIPGLASILYWGLNIPVQVTFLGVNALLLLIALKVLGWQFCIKTLYAAVMFTIFSALGQHWMEGSTLLQGQPFMAIVLGAASLGCTVGLGLASNASTGGTDVVAAMINKYHDISLGKLILLVDISIVTASYFALRNWEEVIYGYIFLFIFSVCVDKVVNMMHQSVQFFIISEKYEQIGRAINVNAQRGCTTISGNGFYSGREVKMLFVLARQKESAKIFSIINDIDPAAFVSQSSVIGVYGLGFDKFKTKRKKNRLQNIKGEQLIVSSASVPNGETHVANS